ncbi:DNA-3-methyladenine glycosylase I [Nonlabens agnitus]|uniref:DNA-3-methyladenine glycosylase I n=1 Tax=Nonlabens agnitus TaxID=870484 RepID=A0A2S9WWP9_9FLAO|nr:DNA-3-methyladenine glycosylase I [Nonlabens agnitus]PRP67900.1 DNA-3-methyladenine glycosylase [Nonlabens agnitus]
MEINNKKHRCGWCGQDPLYQQYHDQEWGVPVYDDQRLFEFLILETMQAGLSWITILKKRENYREALDHFNAVKIAEYDDEKHQELLSNPGIIRNKLKIKSITTNAQIFLDLQQRHGSFSKFIWSYVDHEPITNHWKTYKDIPPNTPLSDQLSKDLKKMGFKFVGSTIVYAFMQATGMVNDHEINCYRYDEV